MSFWLEFSGYKGFPEEDKRLAAIAECASMEVIVLLGLARLRLGIRGIEAAGKSKQASVLSWCRAALDSF